MAQQYARGGLQSYSTVVLLPVYRGNHQQRYCVRTYCRIRHTRKNSIEYLCDKPYAVKYGSPILEAQVDFVAVHTYRYQEFLLLS
jgi:hypothetical protein